MAAEALLADKAYDADERVIGPLEAAGKTAVIPSKKNRNSPRTNGYLFTEFPQPLEHDTNHERGV
jgi:hypothetical protein